MRLARSSSTAAPRTPNAECRTPNPPASRVPGHLFAPLLPRTGSKAIMSELDYPGYDNSEVSAREVIDIVRRRWRTIVGTLAVFVLLAVVVTSRMTPIYRARATMLVEQSPVRSTSKADDDGPLG